MPVGAKFSAPVQTGPGAHPASYRMGTGSFPWVKRPGRGVDHLPPSTAEVKERGASSRVNFTFTLTFLAVLYSTCTLKMHVSNLEENSCYNMSSRPGTHSFQTFFNSPLTL